MVFTTVTVIAAVGKMSFFVPFVKINQQKIGIGYKPYLIAEIGLNHNINKKIISDTIKAAKKSGANAVKFQSYTTDLFINRSDEKIHFLYDIFEQLELTLELHNYAANQATKFEIDFFSTPLTSDWVVHLKKMKVPLFKIASGDVNNFQLLNSVCKEKNPLIISTGAASIDEIDSLINFLKLKQKKNVILNHCVSLYPTPLEKTNLINIEFLQQRYDIPIGFSDHTEGSDAAFIASAMGAVAIEKHFTLDKNLEGPDHKMSNDMADLQLLRQKIDMGFNMRGSQKKQALIEEIQGDYYGKRSLYDVKGDIVAQRPRVKYLPQDKDYLDICLD